MNTPHWEHFDHGADIGVRGYGASEAEAFTQAALALTAVTADPAEIGAGEPVAIRCEAPDDELLLVDWLNALVYEMATRRMLFSRFEVHIDGHTLTATAWGQGHRKESEFGVEVKGATLTAVKVAEEEGQWLAQCVVDV